MTRIMNWSKPIKLFKEKKNLVKNNQLKKMSVAIFAFFIYFTIYRFSLTELFFISLIF